MSKLPERFNEESLKLFMTTIVEKILKDMKSDMSENNKNELVNQIVYSILAGTKDNQVSLDDLKKPEFLKKLVVACVVGTTFDRLEQKQPGQNKSLIDELIAILKPKNDAINKDKDKALDPKLFSDKEKERLKEIFEECYKEMLSDLHKVGIPIPKMKPGQKKELTEEEKKELGDRFSQNTNLLGLINPGMTCSLASVVSCFLGNLCGVVDMNPNSGYAQIDLINRTDDNQFGDSLGLNMKTIMAFISSGADYDYNPITEYETQLRNRPHDPSPFGGIEVR